jgi:hypothetical protein
MDEASVYERFETWGVRFVESNKQLSGAGHD